MTITLTIRCHLCLPGRRTRPGIALAGESYGDDRPLPPGPPAFRRASTAQPSLGRARPSRQGRRSRGSAPPALGRTPSGRSGSVRGPGASQRAKAAGPPASAQPARSRERRQRPRCAVRACLRVALGDARAPAPAPAALRRLRSQRPGSRGRSSGSRRPDPARDARRPQRLSARARGTSQPAGRAQGWPRRPPGPPPSTGDGRPRGAPRELGICKLLPSAWVPRSGYGSASEAAWDCQRPVNFRKLWAGREFVKCV